MSAFGGKADITGRQSNVCFWSMVLKKGLVIFGEQ
jgi:hypothetical protein